jgi:serine/threonine protein kinase
VARDPEPARFERDAKFLAALNRPNIVHTWAVEDWALMMELVTGKALRAPVPIDHARQIASALEAARKSIVHRDRKLLQQHARRGSQV